MLYTSVYSVRIIAGFVDLERDGIQYHILLTAYIYTPDIALTR